ncbi:MAG: PucR family transcriptional regulator ligand-binding domain-containing protein [Bacillota bacterium]
MQVSLTVEQVLATKGFKENTVLAGHEGLGRRVTRITVAELPDTLNWMLGGELVCSTLYCMRENPEAVESWITGMAERDVAALAIKPKRFIDQVPPNAISAANKHRFPLIELPLSVTWPEVISGVMDAMLALQTDRLSRSIQVHEKLTDLVLTSKGMGAIVKTISELISNPVILEDKTFGLIAKAHGHDPLSLAAVKARISQHAIGTLKNHPYVKEKTYEHQKVLRDWIETRMGPVKQLVLPVIAGSELLGWLTTLLVHEEQALDFIALEHGSTVIALELLKEKATLEALAKAKSDYLRDMLEQDYLSDHELQKRAALLGINASLPIVVLIASFDSDIAPQIHFRIEALVKQYDSQAALISRTNDIVIFLHSTNGPKVPVHQATRLGQSIVSMAESEGCTCRVGVGRSYEGVRKLKESYAEAKRALSVAASMGKRVLAFSEMGLHRLLSFIPDDAELVAFCQDVLGDLIEYDAQHGTSLTETLSCYLSLGCNRAETARKLHLHVNSLSYRLERISTILNFDLADPDACFLLHLATRIWEHVTRPVSR